MLKKQYNILLSRYKQAEIYMNNPKIPICKKEMYVNEMKKITERLGILLNSIEKYSLDEAENGFAYEDKEETA